MSSLYWLFCLERLFWMGRVVDRFGTLQSLGRGQRKNYSHQIRGDCKKDDWKMKNE